MRFEDYMKYGCNLSMLSEYANSKGIVERYFGYLKGNYKAFWENTSNIQQVKYAIRMYRAQKEMLSASQMLAEAQQSKENGCVIVFFFLSYYALFHAMQANLFMNINISDEEIVELSHSKVEKYFQDFYCKGSKSIMPHEIIDFFQRLKGFRELYSYSMPFNLSKELNIEIEKLEYYIKLCFQHCSLLSLVVNQIKGVACFELSELQAVKAYFEECCYKSNPETGKLMKDISDRLYWNEAERNNGMDIMPFSLSVEHSFDEYGGYDSHILEQKGFENVGKIRSAAIRFYYNAIM